MQDKLHNTYKEFEIAIAKIHLLGSISDDVFKDFPNTLPENIKQKWKDRLDEMEKDFVEKDSVLHDFHDVGVFDSMGVLLKNAERESEFKQVILRQDLIGYVAYLEAFFQDLNRVIYKERPDWIPQDKEIKWREIWDKSSYDSILDYVIEKHLEKSGYAKITDQITKLNNKPHLLKIKVKKEQLNKLDQLTKTRNLIVHNGSKFNKEYIESYEIDSEKINQKIELSRKDLNKAHILVKTIAFFSYDAVYKMFFQDSE